MGLDPISFYSYTIEELGIAAKKKQELIDQEHRDSWERTRWIAVILLQPNLKKGHRIKPTDLITFPWEKERKAPKKKMTKKELIESIRERDGKA